MDFEAAAGYAERHTLHALLIYQGGSAVFERYGGGYDQHKAHAVYSGTKSFWGVAAVAAAADGLLALDEPVAATIPHWNEEAWKRRVTLRHLLTLSSGIGFGGLGNAVPLYAAALDVDLKNEPGTVFTYGGIPLQVFGAVLASKLAARGYSPHDYLHERILAPIGCEVARWRSLRDGTHPLPTGAFLSAQQWATYGRLIAQRGQWNGAPVLAESALAECFAPSATNPRYGLGFWLQPVTHAPDLVYASGAGGQGMYVVPSRDLVIVHFGDGASFKHEAFLRRLFG